MRGGSQSKRGLSGAKLWGGDLSSTAFMVSFKDSVSVVLPGQIESKNKRQNKLCDDLFLVHNIFLIIKLTMHYFEFFNGYRAIK